MSFSKEEACRKMEEHLQVLVDYDVIPAQVADTLTEYIWTVVGEIDQVTNLSVEDLKTIWEDEDGNGSES